jgi:hypothetical protein
MPGTRRELIALSMALMGLSLTGPAEAQETMAQIEEFDPGRAILNDEPWFDPFRPRSLEPLRGALEDGRLTEDAALMVLERNGRHLALSTLQMSYHHVAQGDLAGEPWMVSF